ncbi:hypothetical protein GQR58_029565 [Nymphon striatum]|nr:hypothetical protein GQR58_029565 [Nymphon striatum]
MPKSAMCCQGVPYLLAVDDPLVAIAHRLGAKTGEVRTGARLREELTPALFAGEHWPKKSFLYGVVAMGDDGRPGQECEELRRVHWRRPRFGEPFLHDTLQLTSYTEPAVAFRKVHPRQTGIELVPAKFVIALGLGVVASKKVVKGRFDDLQICVIHDAQATGPGATATSRIKCTRLVVDQGERAAQFTLGHGANNGEAQASGLGDVVAEANAVIADLQHDGVGLGGQANGDLGALGMIDGVLHKFTDDEPERGRQGVGEHGRVAVDREGDRMCWINQRVTNHAGEGVEYFAELDLVVGSMGEQFVHDANGADAAGRFSKRGLGVVRFQPAALQSQQRGSRLQAVLDPVMDLGDRRVFGHEQPIALAKLRDVSEQHQRAAHDRAGETPGCDHGGESSEGCEALPLKIARHDFDRRRELTSQHRNDFVLEAHRHGECANPSLAMRQKNATVEHFARFERAGEERPGGHGEHFVDLVNRVHRACVHWAYVRDDTEAVMHWRHDEHVGLRQVSQHRAGLSQATDVTIQTHRLLSCRVCVALRGHVASVLAWAQSLGCSVFLERHHETLHKKCCQGGADDQEAKTNEVEAVVATECDGDAAGLRGARLVPKGERFFDVVAVDAVGGVPHGVLARYLEGLDGNHEPLTVAGQVALDQFRVGQCGTCGPEGYEKCDERSQEQAAQKAMTAGRRSGPEHQFQDISYRTLASARPDGDGGCVRRDGRVLLMLAMGHEFIELTERPEALADRLASRRRPHQAVPADGQLVLLNCNHLLDPRTGAAVERRELLDRIIEALSIPEVDGVVGSADVLEELTLLNVLEHRLAFCTATGNAQVGALSGANSSCGGVSSATIAASKFDGAQLAQCWDAGGSAAVGSQPWCIAADVAELAAYDLPTILDLSLSDLDGRNEFETSWAEWMTPVHSTASAVATGAGVWLSVPAISGLGHIAEATGFPILVRDTEIPVAASAWEAFFATDLPLTVTGMLPGVSALFPHHGTVAESMATIARAIRSRSIHQHAA